MTKINLMAVAAGLLLLGTSAAFADDTTDNKPADKPSPELREKLRNMSPEERRQYIKDHPELAKQFQQQRQAMFEKIRPALERAGVNVDELKGLTQAERREKIQPLVEKRIADLEKKKADGTALTEQENDDLNSLKQLKQMVSRNPNNGQHRQPKKAAADDNK